MQKKLIYTTLGFFFFISILSLNLFASFNLLNSVSYVLENKTCNELVYDFVKTKTPVGLNSTTINLINHISLTQGTYNQMFQTTASIDGIKFSIESTGSFDCDDLILRKVTKVK